TDATRASDIRARLDGHIIANLGVVLDQCASVHEDMTARARVCANYGSDTENRTLVDGAFRRDPGRWVNYYCEGQVLRGYLFCEATGMGGGGSPATIMRRAGELLRVLSDRNPPCAASVAGTLWFPRFMNRAAIVLDSGLLPASPPEA